MRSADDESPSSLRRILGDTEADPSSHRVAPKMRRGNIESVEYRDDIPDMRTQLVRRGIVRFVTPAMATGVEQDKLVMWAQGVDIPMTRPTLHVPGHPVLQNQSRAFPLYTIVDSDSLVGRERHGGQLLLRL